MPDTLIPFSEMATLDNPVFKAAGVAPVPAPEVIPFDQVQTAPPQAIDVSQISDIDSFPRKSKEDLSQDETFDPRRYFADNPDVARDPAQLQKLLDVYRARREKGVTLGAVGEAVKAAPGTAVKFAKGLGQLANNVFEFSGLQPIFNKAASVVTGDAFNTQRADALEKESENRARQAYSEFQAGTELSATGLSDLARTGARKIFGKSVKDTSDQELLAQLSDDAAFQNQLREVQAGRGESLKNAGLDADTLAKDGIHLDSNAIENLSLVDPATVIATAGLFKVVGASGKILATAASEAGAAKAATALNNLATQTAGKVVQGVGKGITFTGEKAAAAAGAIPPALAEAGGAVGGALTSGNVEGAYVGAKAARGLQSGIVKVGQAAANVGEGITNLGEQITGQAPISAGVQKLANFANTYGRPVTDAIKGAAIGTAAAAPLALLADENQTAGGILSGGIALGGVAGGLHGTFGAVTDAAANRYFGAHEKLLPAVNSPAYGIDPALDAAHQAAMQTLPVRERNLINNFREGTRNVGGEFYALDENQYSQQVAEAYKRETGKDITPDLLKKFADTHAQFSEYRPDANGNIRKVVLLNSDAAGLLHDAGHLFDASLSPEVADSLRQAVQATFTPEQLADAQARYERRLGTQITPERAMDEFIAEQFNALFHNVPLTEMNAPPSLLGKFTDTIAKGAEALGVDLTGGKATPSLGNPLSVGLRELFKNAAAEIVKSNEASSQPTNPAGPTAPTGLATPTTPPPSGAGPTAAPIPVTPTARNIRVTKAQQDAFAKRAAETGVTEAKANATEPDTRARVNEISDSMAAGNPVLEIEHLGITNEGSPAAPTGRTARRAEQAAGYAELEAIRADNRANAPESIVNTHQKTFVPVRFTNQGGTPTLIAMSLDKVISNIHTIVADAADKNSSRLIPYPSENGKLTEAGWNKAIEDAQAYAENQSNGFRGDGRQLARPTEDLGFSIPAENPDYKPQLLGEAEANFQNLIQGLATPETAREQKGLTPGNIKGQVLAEANQRPLLTPEQIKPKNVSKQQFKSFPGRSLKEVNPLRNELAKAGVDVRDLIEVTERIRAKDIASVKPRPDINFKAPVTDIIRGGFLPGESVPPSPNSKGEIIRRAEEDAREAEYQASLTDDDYAHMRARAARRKVDELKGGESKFLPGEENVAQLGADILKDSETDWVKRTQGFPGGLTGGAYRLGFGLKDIADVQTLKDLAAQAKDQYTAAKNAKNFEAMLPAATKLQFFNEALEVATGSSPSKHALIGRFLGPDWKAPFPGGEAPATEAQFLPRTEAGKKLADEGFDFRMSGQPGTRAVTVLKDGVAVGEFQSAQRDPNVAEISNVQLNKKFRGTGAAEAAYRELLTQLKDDGATQVEGTVVAPQPLALRKKIFGGFDKLELNGEPVSIQDAIRAADEIKGTRKGELINIEAVNNITPDSQFLPKPDQDLRDQSAEIAKSIGIENYQPHQGYAPVDPSLAKRLADFYEKAKSNPQSPEVKKSYDAFIDETLAQYRALVQAGYTIEPWTGRGEPYKNSAEANADVRDNKHLFVLPTQGNFSGAESNPLLKPSGVEGLSTVNDVFRGVHDVLGHAVEGYEFGPRGEFNAWAAHSAMYTPEAQGALAAETLAQNSWVNFGPHLRDENGNVPSKGEKGFVPLTERPFAEQKNVVVPQDLIDEAHAAASKFLPGNEEKKPTAEEVNSLFEKLLSEGKTPNEAEAAVLDLIQKSNPEAKPERPPVNPEEYSNDPTERFSSKDAEKLLKYTKAEPGHSIDGSGWLLRDGNVVILDRGQYHDDILDGLAAATNLDSRSVDQFQSDTGAIRMGTTGSSGLIQDDGNQFLAISLSRRPSGSQLKSIQETLKNRIHGYPDPWYDKIGIDITDKDGNVIVAKVFENPAERGAIARFLTDPFSEEFAASKTGGSKQLPREDVQFLPKKKGNEKTPEFPAYVVAAPQNRGLEKTVDAKGVTEQFWINSKTGKIILAPDGHEEAANDTVFKNRPDIRNSDSVYDEMQARGWVRGVLEPEDTAQPAIHLNGPADLVLGAAGRRTMEDIAFTSGRPVLLNDRQLDIGPVQPNEQAPGLYLPKKTKRDDQGRPLTRGGLIDYERLYKEKIAAEKKQQREDESKPTKNYDIPNNQTEFNARGLTGWGLPDKTFVPLDTAYHENYLADNADELNAKFGTNFSTEPTLDSRLDAINAGFTRYRNEANRGALHIETAAKNWAANRKSILDRILAAEGSIDNLIVSLLDAKGKVVDSINEKLFNVEGPEKLNKIEDAIDSLRARGSQYLPKEQLLPGFKPGSEDERTKMAANNVAAAKRDFPEALVPQYAHDENGKVRLDFEGLPLPVKVEYDLSNTPLAKESAKGLKGPDREKAIAAALGDKLVREYKAAVKNPAIEAGSKWYSTARTRLRKLLGDDSKFFAELLGATSPQTAVDTNFKYAVEAYNQFKSGAYDDILAKYREGKKAWADAEIDDFLRDTKIEKPTRGQFLDWWVKKYNLIPEQSNGKRFGLHSRAVLRVLDGSWRSEVKGPKTPNFTGNLTGETFAATIDLWAARLLHRLANEGNTKRWRILPGNETGVTDPDFYLGQSAYRHAAEKLGIKPDALQAVLWFAEKHYWEDRGWTKKQGAKKSDFNSLLGETEKSPLGKLVPKKRQTTLEL